MEKEILTFNDLPQVVAQLRDEVMGMRAMLTRQQVESSKPVKENRHKPMTVEEAIEYTHIPQGNDVHETGGRHHPSHQAWQKMDLVSG